MNIFYTPNIENSPYLPEEESAHVVRVLRMKTGDKLLSVDGKGGFYEVEITSPHPKHCEIKIVNKTNDFNKRNNYLHIAIAPTKNIDRLEWFLEKATEIGIDEITPITCRFSERKVIKEERLIKIIVSAMKQSLKAYLPKLNPLTTFAEFINKEIAEQFRNDNRFIAHCHDSDKILLQNAYSKGQNALIMIGPEGDFSKEEVEAAISCNFKAVSLGNSRLRTETAGLVACHTISLFNVQNSKFTTEF